MFADVLVRVVPSAEAELPRLEVAVDLAQRLHCRLEGVFVEPFGDGKGQWAKTLFERAVNRSPLETTWRVVDGRSGAALLHQARRSDLVVLPEFSANLGTEGCAAEGLVLESGRPAMVLPAAAAGKSIGHKVLIGWNDTRESTRAVHDAIPILLAAERVIVLTVTADGDLEPLGDRMLADHLRQHGVTAELRRRHGEAAEEIASEARELGADMLVIGLRGGPDRALGDVSRKFIRTASLPVFCSN